MGENIIPQLRIDENTCENDIFSDNILIDFGLTRITTGYFGSTPSGKCAHGIIPDAGIHKDEPGRLFYNEAFALATQSTTEYVNLVIADLAGNDAAVRALFGLDNMIGFIIDDTGSMGTEISGVKVAVNNIINTTSSSDLPPASYLLVIFGDPNVSSAFVSPDPSALLSAVNRISVGGGGDCPEFSQSGLLQAINAAQPNSKLYLFTDATSKDAFLSSNVSAAATAKKITINYALTGSCSPIDPAYLRVARDTGGQAFYIGPNETAKLFSLIEPTLKGDIESLLIVSGELDSLGKQYDIPVDNSISSLTFSIIHSGIYTLNRPDGSVVNNSDPDVEIIVLSDSTIVTVSSPVVGTWSLELSGTSNFSVSVLANTSLAIEQFNFLKEGGREAHTGLFPIQGQPLINSDMMAMGELIGDYLSAQFQLRTLDGELIQTIPLLQGENIDLPSSVFSGKFTIPSDPFRVYVTGLNNLDESYIRVFPTTIKAQLVAVNLSLTEPLIVKVGESLSFKVNVQNYGPAASYNIDCPNSNLQENIVINSCDSKAKNILAESGCTLSDLITAAANSKNHGSFVSSVTKIAKDAKSLKLISGRDYGKIISCAAKSGIE